MFGDEVMTATLPQDTWRTRHDAFKVVMVNIANEARIPIDCEVFGLFRDLIPAQLLEEGAELGFGRQRLGLCPDFKLRLPTADGPQDCLGELKFISAGVSRYPVGRREKQVDRRARELPGFYRWASGKPCVSPRRFRARVFCKCRVDLWDQFLAAFDARARHLLMSQEKVGNMTRI